MHKLYTIPSDLTRCCHKRSKLNSWMRCTGVMKCEILAWMLFNGLPLKAGRENRSQCTDRWQQAFCIEAVIVDNCWRLSVSKREQIFLKWWNREIEYLVLITQSNNYNAQTKTSNHGQGLGHVFDCRGQNRKQCSKVKAKDRHTRGT